MVGVVGWAVLIGLVLAWEGLSIAAKVPGWPSSSDMLRAATRSVVGRWLLFGAWLWLGWHLFMRGWTSFLAGPGATTPPRSSRHAAQLFTQVVVPLLVCYLGFLALVGAARRDKQRSTSMAAQPPAYPAVRERVLRLARTVVGGYAAFVGVVGVYAILSGQLRTDLVSSAVSEGGFLAFVIVVPAFALGAAVQASWRARRGRGVQ